MRERDSVRSGPSRNDGRPVGAAISGSMLWFLAGMAVALTITIVLVAIARQGRGDGAAGEGGRPVSHATIEQSAVVVLPNLLGTDRTGALENLDSLGLSATVSSVESLQPAGSVVDQDPAPGSTVVVGSAVTIAVAIPNSIPQSNVSPSDQMTHPGPSVATQDESSDMSGWPTDDREFDIGVSIWLGANFEDLPDWMSCSYDKSICLLGMGDVVKVLDRKNMRYLAVINEGTIDPLGALLAAGIGRKAAVSALKPGDATGP